MTMKIRKIIIDKKDAMKNLLTFMYDSVCAQKAILEMLLEDLEEGIYLFRGAITDFINEILIKEERSLRANRSAIRKELATSD